MIEADRVRRDLFVSRQKIIHCSNNDRTLIIDEVRQVHPIGFCVQVGAAIFDRCIAQQNADGDVPERREIVLEHEPIEQRPCHSPVAIAKRMLVAQRKMQRDGLDQRVQVITVLDIVVGLIDPVRQHLEPGSQATGRRWHMNGIAIAVLNDHIISGPERARRISAVFNSSHAHFMQPRDKFNAQWLMPVIPGERHHLVVTDDHFLIRGARQSLTFEHVLGNQRRSGRAFQLAAADRFVFDQVVKQIMNVCLLADLARHVLKCRSGGISVNHGNGFLRQRRHQPGTPVFGIAQG